MAAPTGATLDGVIAKRRDFNYRTGDRSGMQKIKNLRSADCVVGGFRYNENSPLVGSLLLGLYDRNGRLNHVGFTSTIKREDKPALTKKAKVVGRSAGIHRQRAWRPEPLGHETFGRMGAVKAHARCRDLLRPFHRRALQTWHAAVALASRRGAKAVHYGSNQAEESKADGAPRLTEVCHARPQAGACCD
jgi:hypothetical protein